MGNAIPRVPDGPHDRYDDRPLPIRELLVTKDVLGPSARCSLGSRKSNIGIGTMNKRMFQVFIMAKQTLHRLVSLMWRRLKVNSSGIMPRITHHHNTLTFGTTLSIQMAFHNRC